MRSLTKLSFVTGAFALLVSSVAHSDVSAGKYAKAYTGDDGLSVIVVDAILNSQKGKLIEFTGTSSQIDGIVLFHTVETYGRGIGLQAIISDRYHWTLTTEDTRWGGKRIRAVFPEDVRKKHWLYYNKKESDKIKKSDMVAKFKKQTQKHFWHSIQLYKGEGYKGHTKGTFKRAVNEAKRACKAPIGARIDWPTFAEKVKKDTPIASICRLPAEVLADLCDNNKQPEGAKKLTLITCRFGKKEGLSSTSKNGLIWTISKDTLPSRAKMKTYIEKTIK